MKQPLAPSESDPLLVGLLALCWIGLSSVALAYLGRG
jgi:hypothetical protein